MWSALEGKLKQAAGLDAMSELNDAIREYGRVTLKANASPTDVEEFLNMYLHVRTAMKKHKLLSDSDPLLVAREFEDFKKQCENFLC